MIPFDVHILNFFTMENIMEVLPEYRDPEIIKKLVIGDGSMNLMNIAILKPKIVHFSILQEGK